MNPLVRLFLKLLTLLSVIAALGALLLLVHSERGRRAAGRRYSALTAAFPVPPETAPDRVPLSLSAALFEAPAAAEKSNLAARFRLAGTVVGDGAFGGSGMAILDDRIQVRQLVVQQGQEVLPGVRLLKIAPDSVTLQHPDGGEEILTIEHISTAAAPVFAPDGQEAGVAEPSSGSATPRALAAARFGGREVRNEPQRLLQIFDTMEPVYVADPDGERRIDGYRVRVQGEADFFLAAGLEEGDVVKSVNKQLMTNRRRAEALISSFIEGNGTLWILEVERNGQTLQQVVEIE